MVESIRNVILINEETDYLTFIKAPFDSGIRLGGIFSKALSLDECSEDNRKELI